MLDKIEVFDYGFYISLHSCIFLQISIYVYMTWCFIFGFEVEYYGSPPSLKSFRPNQHSLFALLVLLDQCRVALTFEIQ